VLRNLVESDVPALLRLFGDPAVMKYWSSAPLVDESEARALLHHIHEGFSSRSLFQWGFALRETGDLIGTCTLFHVDRAHRRAEVGYALRPHAWGRGLASEALSVLIAFAFGPLGLHRLEADADPENVRSLRTLERQGFRQEGYLRERWHHMGELRDAIFFGLLRSEWSGGRLPP
jgi:[ribosomal protein S5]-alanine N-acetyltransferase